MELTVYDRNYEKWSFTPNIFTTINPLTNKLFHSDIINIDGNIIKSPYRVKNDIPGVLILTGKTYGRINDNGKLLYKCIPNDICLPCFLIPYEEKKTTFIKKKTNKYITFKFKEWNDKHPIGILTNTIGDVSILENYYQYQLYCKNLNKSINKEIIEKIKSIKKENIFEQISANLENRSNEQIFSIDPEGCKDIDDAVGLKIIDKYNSIISIYISNVALLLDYLNLWTIVGERVSTIYLPNGKFPMLPNILSDDLCSLLQNTERCAFCLDIYVYNNTTVTKVEFNSVLINVKKNYVYEENLLLQNETYIQLMTITKNLNKQYKYVDDISDSHNLIEFYMIFMNYESSKYLLQQKTGIFRSAQINNNKEQTSNINTEFIKFLKIFNITNCNYCLYDKATSHDLIGDGLDSYVHITSPIRRLVDLINLIEFQRDKLSKEAGLFSDFWLEKIDFINKTMKSIRKLQNNCTLLHTYINDKSQKHFTGLLFNKIIIDKDIYKYSVYVPFLKMISTIKTNINYDNYTVVNVTTHLFNDEDNIIKKIRLTLL